MLEIDGAMGEGGGQILRTAISLSMCLGKPFRIINIRATRSKPGLRPQHLLAVEAAAAVSHAEVEGAQQGAQQLVFRPQGLFPGHYDFSIGTAGSTSLVLQTLLPAMMLADSPSSFTLEGGTHNPLAPSFEFLNQAFLPLLMRMGPLITLRLERPGYYPKGGGRLHVDIRPVSRLKPLLLRERGEIQQIRAEILLSHLPEHIALRERGVLLDALPINEDNVRIRRDDSALGAGNVVTVVIQAEHVSEVFTALGERGVPAEDVAGRLVQLVQDYLETDVPVGPHLADQLLLPIALAGAGSFVTGKPSRHTLTNIAVIKCFMETDFQVHEVRPAVWSIDLNASSIPAA